jgi:hypothetical protein
VIAHPLPRRVGLDGGEHVEAGLEPRRPPLRDLKRLVEGTLSPQDMVVRAGTPFGGDVAVQFHHRGARGHGLRAVDLDLKVLLGGRGHGLGGGHPECEPYQHRERLPAHTRSVRRLCQFGYREPGGSGD